VHIPGMTKATRTKVLFSCPKCGLSYQTVQEQFPETKAGRFECIDCFTEIHAWSGVYDYAVWKRIKVRPTARARKL
jgi:hypothetical protein